MWRKIFDFMLLTISKAVAVTRVAAFGAGLDRFTWNKGDFATPELLNWHASRPVRGKLLLSR